MKLGPNISIVGALLGDPARANMLTSLMSGQALTATELAAVAGIAASTASGHLSRLQEGGLVLVEQQGRHRYYRLAGPDVAVAIEALMDLSTHAGQRQVRTGPKDPELRHARVCYDHLAGERGVDLFTRLTQKKLIALSDEGVCITAAGRRTFTELGIDVDALLRAKRPVCRTCLDWSERRMHLAGSLGAALLNCMFERGWARRVEGTRIVRFSPKGLAAFQKLFDDR